VPPQRRPRDKVIAGSSSTPFEDAGRDPDKASIRKAVEIVEAVRAAVGPTLT